MSLANSPEPTTGRTMTRELQARSISDQSNSGEPRGCSCLAPAVDLCTVILSTVELYMFCEEFVLLHGPPVYVYTVPCRAVLYLYANGSLCVCVFNLAVSLVPGLAIGNAIVNAARVGSMADPHSPRRNRLGLASQNTRSGFSTNGLPGPPVAV